MYRPAKPPFLFRLFTRVSIACVGAKHLRGLYLKQGTVTNKDVLVGLGRHARVLIVEDEPVSALILKRFFEQKGIRFDHAVDGQQAYDLFRRNRYRMVISDWRVS